MTGLEILALVLLIVVLISISPVWEYSRGWGYAPVGGITLILVIVLLVLLL